MHESIDFDPYEGVPREEVLALLDKSELIQMILKLEDTIDEIVFPRDVLKDLPWWLGLGGVMPPLKFKYKHFITFISNNLKNIYMKSVDQTWCDFIEWCMYNNLNPDNENSMFIYQAILDAEEQFFMSYGDIAEEPDYEI